MIIPDGVTTIETSAFEGCSGLTAIAIPTSVSNIRSFAFSSCIGITNLAIPPSVAGIDYATFDNCTGLKHVTLPIGISNLASFAFYGCSDLLDISIPASTDTIGFEAFASCKSLKQVLIPGNVRMIEQQAFGECPSLAGVYFEGDAPSPDEPLSGTTNVIIYYLPGTKGWGSTFWGRPTMLWMPQLLVSDPGFGIRSNQFGFRLAWANGTAVVVESCTNLAHPYWIPLQSNILSGNSSYFTYPAWTNYPAHFFRLRDR